MADSVHRLTIAPIDFCNDVATGRPARAAEGGGGPEEGGGGEVGLAAADNDALRAGLERLGGPERLGAALQVDLLVFQELLGLAAGR